MMELVMSKNKHMMDDDMHQPDPNDTFVQNLFEEVKGRAISEGIQNYDEWIDLVEDLIQEKLNDGELTKDDDLLTIQKDLEMMWADVEGLVG